MNSLLEKRLKLKHGSNVAPTVERKSDRVVYTHLLNPNRRLQSHLAPNSIARKRINNTKMVDLSEAMPDTMEMAGIDVSDVKLNTTSVGAITSYPFKQRMAKEISESCWVVNGVDILNYFCFDVNTQKTVGRISQLCLRGDEDYVIAAPFAVIDEDNDGELLLNPLNKLDNVGTYMHPGDHGYAWSGSEEIPEITLYGDFDRNLAVVSAIAPAINNQPGPNSRYCLPYEFAYYCLIASAGIEGGSGGFTATMRNVVNGIIASINTWIFQHLDLTKSGHTLTELTISMEDWYLLLANFFARSCVDGRGAVLDISISASTGVAVRRVEKIISDTIYVDCKNVSVYVPEEVINKKFEFRGMIRFPIRFKVFKSSVVPTADGTFAVYSSHGCKYHCRIVGSDSDYYFLDAYIEGFVFPSQAGIYDLSEIADRTGVKIVIGGFITAGTNVILKTQDSAVTVSDYTNYINIQYVDPSNRSFIYKENVDPTIHYSESSSYESVPGFFLSQNDYFMDQRFTEQEVRALRAAFNSKVLSADRNMNCMKAGFIFDHQDYGASRYLTINAKNTYYDYDSRTVKRPTGDVVLYFPLTKLMPRRLDMTTAYFDMYFYNRSNFNDFISAFYSTKFSCRVVTISKDGLVTAEIDNQTLKDMHIWRDRQLYNSKGYARFEFNKLSTTIQNAIQNKLSTGEYMLALEITRKSDSDNIFGDSGWIEMGTILGKFDYLIGQDTVEINDACYSDAFKADVIRSFNKKETYFNCDMWRDSIGWIESMIINPDFYVDVLASDAAYYNAQLFNVFKSSINSTAIRHAFANLNRLEYEQAVQLFTVACDDIDPMIMSHLLSAVKDVRINRSTNMINSIMNSILVDFDESPTSNRLLNKSRDGKESTDAEAERDFDLESMVAFIDSQPQEVDVNYGIDFPEKVEDVAQWFDEQTQSYYSAAGVKYDELTKKYYTTFGEMFKGVTVSSLNITADELNITDPLELDMFNNFIESHKNDSLSTLIARLQDPRTTDDEIKLIYGILSKEFNDLKNEYATLVGDSLADKLESYADELLDDEGLYNEDNAGTIAAEIDNVINNILANINDSSVKDAANARLNALTGNISEYFEDTSDKVKERFSKLSAEVKSKAVGYYREAREKIAKEAENLNNILSFKVTNLINMVKDYGSDVTSYLQSITGMKVMNKSDYGWQDTQLFTPASNISLATGVVGNGLLGALSVGFSLMKRVVNGVASTIKSAVTTAVQDGVSFKKRMSGYETLALQACSKIYSPEYLNETYSWLAEKLFANLTGFNDHYLVSQVGNLYIFFQDAPNGQIMITANPKLKLGDDTDIGNDFSVAEAMADSIRSCITKQNAILTLCANFGMFGDSGYCPYDVPSKDKLLGDILSRAQGKSAEGVIVAKSIIWGLGIALGAVLCCTGYGTVAGVALIAGACAVGSAMCGEPETQDKIERLHSDSAYANGLIMSSDLRDIWCDSIPASMLDTELSMLDFLSNCSIEYQDNRIEYMDLVSDGSGGAIDFVGSSNPEFDGIGFLPMVVMSGTPKMKYKLVTDLERTLKSIVLLSAMVAASVIAVSKAVTATRKKMKQRKMDRLAAKQWSLKQPSSDDPKYEGMSDDEKAAALQADMRGYEDQQFKYARKTTRLSNALDRMSGSGGTGGGGSSILSTILTDSGSAGQEIEAEAESNNVAWETRAAAKSASEGAVTIEGVVNGLANQLGTDEQTVMEMLRSISSGSGGDAVLAVIIAALAAALGVPAASVAVYLAKAIKNSARAQDDNQ